jgi:hypothetical protein
VSAIWFGTNNAAREIVSEAPIYKRERMFNQGILAYMLSKITVLGSFAAVQSLIFILIISLRYSNSVLTWEAPVNTFFWMVFVSLSASMLGLLLSAIVTTSEKVMTLVPIALIPQIMLSGILAKITHPFVEVLSYFILSRWGNEGFCNVQENVRIDVPIATIPTDIELPSSENNSENLRIITKEETVNSIEQLKLCFHNNYEKTFGDDWAFSLKLDFVVISFLSLMFFIGIYIALKRKDSMKIK